MALARLMLSAPEPPFRLLPLRTEIESESAPSPASIELPARVRAAITVSFPAAPAIVAPLAPLLKERESLPAAKETLTSVAEELNTTVSLAVSLVPPLEALAMEEPITALLKVRRSDPLPPTRVDSVTVPVRENRSSP
jgi:hypothetical protein